MPPKQQFNSPNHNNGFPPKFKGTVDCQAGSVICTPDAGGPPTPLNPADPRARAFADLRQTHPELPIAVTFSIDANGFATRVELALKPELAGRYVGEVVMWNWEDGGSSGFGVLRADDHPDQSISIVMRGNTNHKLQNVPWLQPGVRVSFFVHEKGYGTGVNAESKMRGIFSLDTPVPQVRVGAHLPMPVTERDVANLQKRMKNKRWAKVEFAAHPDRVASNVRMVDFFEGQVDFDGMTAFVYPVSTGRDGQRFPQRVPFSFDGPRAAAFAQLHRTNPELFPIPVRFDLAPTGHATDVIVAPTPDLEGEHEGQILLWSWEPNGNGIGFLSFCAPEGTRRVAGVNATPNIHERLRRTPWMRTGLQVFFNVRNDGFTGNVVANPDFEFGSIVAFDKETEHGALVLGPVDMSIDQPRILFVSKTLTSELRLGFADDADDLPPPCFPLPARFYRSEADPTRAEYVELLDHRLTCDSQRYTARWSKDTCTLQCTSNGDRVFQEFADDVKRIGDSWLAASGVDASGALEAPFPSFLNLGGTTSGLPPAIIAVDAAGTNRRDDAFACELLSSSGSTIELVASTFVVNIVDEGLACGAINEAMAARAADVFENVHLGEIRRQLWPSDSKTYRPSRQMKNGMSKFHVASAIASSRELKFTWNAETKQLTLAGGEITLPRLVRVKLSEHLTTDFADDFLDRIFRSKLPTADCTAEELLRHASVAIRCAVNTAVDPASQIASPGVIAEGQELEWVWLRAVTNPALSTALSPEERKMIPLILAGLCGLAIRRDTPLLGWNEVPTTDEEADQTEEVEEQEEEESAPEPYLKFKFDDIPIRRNPLLLTKIDVTVRREKPKAAGGDSKTYAFMTIDAMKVITRHAAQRAFAELTLPSQPPFNNLREWQLERRAEAGSEAALTPEVIARSLPHALRERFNGEAPTIDEIEAALKEDDDLPNFREFLKANGAPYPVVYWTAADWARSLPPDSPDAFASTPEYTKPMREYESMYHQLLLLRGLDPVDDSAEVSAEGSIQARREALWRGLLQQLGCATPQELTKVLTNKRVILHSAQADLKVAKRACCNAAFPQLFFPGRGIVVKQPTGKVLYVWDLQPLVVSDRPFVPKLVPIPEDTEGYDELQHNEVVDVSVGGPQVARVGKLQDACRTLPENSRRK